MPGEYDQPNAQKIRYPMAEVNAVDTRTLSGNVTLTERDGRIHRLNNGGAGRDVTLFAPSPENAGRMDWVYNSGGGVFSLTVKDSAGNTLGTVAQTKTMAVISTGTSHVIFLTT